MIIQQIRNATLVVTYAGKRFLVDPWFQKKGTGRCAPTPWPEKNKLPSPGVELPLPVEQIMEGIDAIIVTHIHPDHFEEETATMLDKGIPVFTRDAKARRFIEKMGFRQIRSLSAQGVRFGEITLIKTKGQHGTSRYRNAGAVCGVVFQAPCEKKLYIAGDTVYYDGVAKELDIHRPDVVVLNACAATLLFVGRLIMGKEDVLSVCKAAPYATVIASHMETVNHATVSRAELRDFLTAHGVNEQVLIPADGESIRFEPDSDGVMVS